MAGRAIVFPVLTGRRGLAETGGSRQGQAEEDEFGRGFHGGRECRCGSHGRVSGQRQRRVAYAGQVLNFRMWATRSLISSAVSSGLKAFIFSFPSTNTPSVV